MDMAFLEPRGGDLPKPSFRLQLSHRCGTDVAHSGADTTHYLIKGVRQRPFIGHSALDAFRHELAAVFNLALEIAVFRASLHGAEAAHTAVHLVALALINHHLARRFVGTGKEA